MLEKLKLVEARYLEMAERAAQPDFYNDPKAASQLLKEQRQLEPIITAYRSYRRTQAEQEDLRAMLSEGLEPEMKALCQEEFSANKKKLEELEQELKILLLPRDPNDDKSVIMEIRGGVGGEESALFAHSLYRMYTMYAESKRWTVTLLNYNEGFEIYRLDRASDDSYQPTLVASYISYGAYCEKEYQQTIASLGLYRENIINLYYNNTIPYELRQAELIALFPKDTATRAEISTMLMRYLTK